MASSTYLQLCNYVLTRLNEVSLTSTNFASAVSFQSAVKDFINNAISDIQNAELEWPFNFSTATITTTANSTSTSFYSLAADYATVDWDSFFIQPLSTTITAASLKYIDFDEWRSKYKAADRQIMNDAVGWGKPTFIFQNQANPTQLGLSTVPDAVYTIEYDYWKVPAALSVYTDVHTLPTRYEHIIIDGAMYYSYLFRDNIQEASDAKKKFEVGVAAMRTELINKQKDMTNGMIARGGGVRYIG